MVYCTSCNIYSTSDLLHPLLAVPICSNCCNKFNDQINWPRGPDGKDEYCTWCSEGGDLVVCDKCPKVFCHKCIFRNFGEKKLQKINLSISWLCFICDPKQLKDRLLIPLPPTSFPSTNISHSIHLPTIVYTPKLESSDSDEEFIPKKHKSKHGKKDKHKHKKQKKKENIKGGRKNLRKIKSEELLAESTQLANQEEKDHQLRLKMRISFPLDYQKQNQICINPSRSEKETPLYISANISQCLKDHQIDGIRFLWDHCIESIQNFTQRKKNLQQIKNEQNDDSNCGSGGVGCILAHYMGLGKTLQCLAFLQNGLGRHGIVITPLNALKNWIDEINLWINNQDFHYYDISNKPKIKQLSILKNFEQDGGLLIINYESFRNIVLMKRMGKLKNEDIDYMKKVLISVPEIAILDEGHRIKSDLTGISQSLHLIKTRLRVVLTGTPLQNNLMEYYHMVDFVRPNYLGTPDEFRNRFENPIRNGECSNSTPSDVKLMKERVFVLFYLLAPLIHRCDYNQISDELPNKTDFVLFIRLSHVQKLLYRTFLRSSNRQLFQAYHVLMKMLNHPDIISYDCFPSGSGNTNLLPSYLSHNNSQNKPITQRKTTLGDIINDNPEENNFDEETSESDYWSSSSDDIKDNDLDRELDHLTYRNEKAQTHSSQQQKKFQQIEYNLWAQFVDPQKGYSKLIVENSGKMVVTLFIINMAIIRSEKVLIFSQSLQLLDILEIFFQQLFHFQKNKDYYRLDGSTSGNQRQKDINSFNKPSYQSIDSNNSPDLDQSFASASVFLISTKAGSLGVNLVGANRVIIFDACWNPTNDIQAAYRAYRYGQEKDVYIYRLISAGTMEQKIYERQMLKQGLSLRVVDETCVPRLFNQDDLFEYNENSDLEDDLCSPINTYLEMHYPHHQISQSEHISLDNNTNNSLHHHPFPHPISIPTSNPHTASHSIHMVPTILDLNSPSLCSISIHSSQPSPSFKGVNFSSPLPSLALGPAHKSFSSFPSQSSSQQTSSTFSLSINTPYSPPPPSTVETGLPSDPILLSLLHTHGEKWIKGYHQPNQLLKEDIDEDLTEADQRLALQNYQKALKEEKEKSFSLPVSTTNPTFSPPLPQPPNSSLPLKSLSYYTSIQPAPSPPIITSSTLISSINNKPT